MQTNGQHSVFLAVACSRMISPQVPVISFLYSKFDPIFMFQEHLADLTIYNVKSPVQSTTVEFSSQV